MEWRLVFWLISVFIFWGYALWYIFNHEIPKSWSDTFYRLGKIYGNRNKGYILTGVLWGLTLPIIPVAIEKHTFMFLVLCLIALIGSAPAFKDSKMEYNVHMFGSIGSVATAIVAFAVFYKLYIVAALLAIIVALLYTNIVKINNKIMWIESLVILSGHIIILLKDIY